MNALEMGIANAVFVTATPIFEEKTVPKSGVHKIVMPVAFV